MESMGSKGSSKRKPAFTMKVKLSAKKKSASDSEDDFDSEDSSKPIKKTKSKGNNSDNDSIPDLPEGTVVVKPEAVKEKKPRFSGPEFSKAPENLDIVNCTSCGRQINPNVSGAAKKHPHLKVLVCRKCFSYYKSGKIEQDEDGLDEQCRWCGEGGRLSGCDFCHNAFCKACIIRNFSRAEHSKVMADDGSKWKCYVCDPSKLKKLTQECTALLEKIEKEKMKAKMRSNRDGKTVSAGRPQKTTGTPSGSKDNMSSRTFNKDVVSISNISISSSKVVETVSQLYALTSGFQTMLEVLKADLDSCSDVQDSSREVSTKRDRGARTLRKSLQTYFTSVNALLNQAHGKVKSAMENGETSGDEGAISNGHVSLSDDGSSVEGGRGSVPSKTTGKSCVSKLVFQKVGHGNDYKSLIKKQSYEHSFVDSCDVPDDSENDSDLDLPVTFAPQGNNVSISHSEAEVEKIDVDVSPDVEKTDVGNNSLAKAETENEAAQLELLQELAEEMCKEQNERRKEEECKKSEKEDNTKDNDDNLVMSCESSDDSEDSDSVSSSNLLMSSDQDFNDSWNKKTKKKRSDSGRKHGMKPEDKTRKAKKKEKKKKLKEMRKERKKIEKQEQKGTGKTTKRKEKNDDSEDDLAKEISKLEQEPKLKKVKIGSTDMDSSEDDLETLSPKKEKAKVKPSEDKEGKF